MISEITGNTRLICLLGSPVAHSVSPLMHNAAFELLGLPYRYLCFDVKEDRIKEAVEALRLFHARGFNCTMPLKTAMAGLADELSLAAQLMGAVNTVVIENGKLIGHNTDGMGYMQSVKEAGFSILGKKMTLLGAGGAATAICVQAALDGLAEIEVFSRPGERFRKMEKLSKALAAKSGCRIYVRELSDRKALEKSLEESAILTNGTCVGMAPEEEACPIPETIFLPSHLIVSDIIYNPRKTRLLKLAEACSCPYFNGMDMLLYQGAAAFELWTGQKMPVQEIKGRVI